MVSRRIPRESVTSICKQIDVTHVGTDPSQAADMKNRQCRDSSEPGNHHQRFRRCAWPVRRYHRESLVRQPATADLPGMREQMNGNRPDGMRAPLSYKVRPLNGIWATPPYLHNGSVPNLYALLSPVAERPKKVLPGQSRIRSSERWLPSPINFPAALNSIPRSEATATPAMSSVTTTRKKA